jgi:hypothetical protein
MSPPAQVYVIFSVTLDVAGKTLEQLSDDESFNDVLMRLGAEMTGAGEEDVVVRLSFVQRRLEASLHFERRLQVVTATFEVSMSEDEADTVVDVLNGGTWTSDFTNQRIVALASTEGLDTAEYGFQVLDIENVVVEPTTTSTLAPVSDNSTENLTVSTSFAVRGEDTVETSTASRVQFSLLAACAMACSLLAL